TRLQGDWSSDVCSSDLDDNGQLITGELTDYALPRAHLMPWIESHHTCTPSPVNPLGVKGVGEAGTIGCSPAVVSSAVDALSPLEIGRASCRERVEIAVG